MDPFVREFQPDRYELWRAGLEVGNHPEDELSKLYPRRDRRQCAARSAKTSLTPAPATHKYIVYDHQSLLLYNLGIFS